MSETPGWFLQNGTALAVLVGFALVMILSAWAANRRPVDRPGPIVIAVSFYATFLSTNTFLGQAGFGYKVGVAWLLAGGVFILCALGAWFVVARPMIRDARRVLGDVEDLDQITVPEYLRRKYGSPAIGYVSAGIVFFASLLYMLAVFKGIGHIFSRILHVSHEAAVLAVLVLVAAYTSWGMIRAILHTDVVQGVVMVAGVMALFLACVKRADWALLADSVDLDASGRALGGALLQWDTLMSPLLIVGLSLGTGIKLMVAPRLVVRFLLFRHAAETEIRRAKWLTVALMSLTIPMLFVLGILAHGIVPQSESQFYFQNTDELVPYLVETLFGSFWGAVVLAGFLSAALSSIDSVLHVAGSALVVDVWANWRPRTPGAVIGRLQRAVMIPVAAAPAIAALHPPADIVPLTAMSGALFGGCFFPALIIGLWWKQPGRGAVLASIVAGGSAVIAWSLGLQHVLSLESVHPVFAGLLASTAVYACWRPRADPSDTIRPAVGTSSKLR